MPTVIHLTDPHIPSDPEGTIQGVPAVKSLKSVLEMVQKECPDPDLLVWTGDLANEGASAGYENFLETLGAWKERSRFLPGNHDNRETLRAFLPGIGGERDAPVAFRFSLGNWRLIGLDSHVPGKEHGELSPNQISGLRFWLEENPGFPTLLFLHHPPIPVGSWMDAMGMKNPDALHDLVAGNPDIRAIFTGHVHHVFEGRFAGVPVYTTPSTAYQIRGGNNEFAIDPIPPGFRLIELDENSFGARVVRLPKLLFPPGIG